MSFLPQYWAIKTEEPPTRPVRAAVTKAVMLFTWEAAAWAKTPSGVKETIMLSATTTSRLSSDCRAMGSAILNIVR